MLQQRSRNIIDAYNNYLEKLTEECINNARKIRVSRKDIYTNTVLLEDYLLNGPQDLLYEIHKKNLRVLNMLRTGKWNPAGDNPIWDNIYDIINYASLLYAFLKMQEGGNDK